ncbi:MAG: MMPL family transporter [Thermoplasmata archaeon]
MLEGRFRTLGNFIKKRYKAIIIVWVVLIVALLPFAAMSTSLINYNVEDIEFAGSSHTQSVQAQNIMNSEFNFSKGNSSGTVAVLYVESPFNSSTSYSIWEKINSTYAKNLSSLGPSGIVSPYQIADGVVNSLGNSTDTIYGGIMKASNSTISAYGTFTNATNGFESFTSNLITIDGYFNSTYHNVSRAVVGYNGLFESISGASSLIYGIPIAFYGIYLSSPLTNSSEKSSYAYSALLKETNNFSDNQTSLGYFNAFYASWSNIVSSNSSFPNTTTLQLAINDAFTSFSAEMTKQQQQFFYSVLSSFNVTTYQSSSERLSITDELALSISSPSSAVEMQIFNYTFENFVINGSLPALSANITGTLLSSNNNAISEFTNSTFGETPDEFASSFESVSQVNSSVVENQMNHSLLSNSMSEFYKSVNMPVSVFYSGLINNNTSQFRQYFINSAAAGLKELASTLDQNSSSVVSTFLSEGSSKSAMNLTESFLMSHFKDYPYFSFSNPAQFVSSSVKAKGNVSSLVNGNYSEAGIDLSSSVFHSLVPRDFSGYLIIIDFTPSSLNNSQLNVLSSYLSGIQNRFDPVKIYSTSDSQIANGIEDTAYSGLIYSLVAGMILSVIIVGIYFRSAFLAFVPLMFFGLSMVVILGLSELIFGIIMKTTLSFIVTTLSAMLILGLSTDYSVYILNRYTKEESQDKLGTTVQWAGHAVFTSGLTVILSYIVLGIFKVPIIGAGGFVNALGIAISLGVALTLLPSFMIIFKKRIKQKRNLINFRKIAMVSRKHKKALVAVLIVIFISTLVVYETTPTSFSLFSLIPDNSGKAGYYEMTSAFGGDTLSPSYIVLTFPNQIYYDGHFNETDIGVLNNITSALIKDNGISGLTTLTYPFGNYVNVQNISGSSISKSTILNQSLTFIGKDGSTVLLNFSTKYVSYTEQGINAIAKVDNILKQVTPTDVKYAVGGTPQSLLDSSNSINTSTYDIIIILSIMIFGVLAFQLTSILTPLRLLFNVGTSALLAVSLFYLVFHYLMKLPLIVFGPLFVIVTLFGVGLDYDIFMVTKAREAVMRGESDEDAIAESIEQNGGVILVLGFILAGVFGSLIFSSIGIISEIGFAVTAGVLIDTLLSWLFLIPALMLVLKKYNWWPSNIRHDR